MKVLSTMYGVVCNLHSLLVTSVVETSMSGTDFLPASSPEDYPKIIKSGIDEEGQHHKSPNITGPSGIATLLHRIGRQQLLERLLDTTGTEEYNLRVITGENYLKDIYVKRQGVHVEVSSLTTIPFEYLHLVDWADHF